MQNFHKYSLLQQVKTRSSVEIAQPRDTAHQTGEAAGPEAELGLVVRVDQPKAAVDLLQAGAAQQTLEELYRSGRPLDFQEFGDSRGTLPAPLQNPAVQPGGHSR